MIKNTSINPSLNPSGQQAFAESILGKVVEPQTRWSPGSLSASVLDASESKQVILISMGQLVSLSHSPGGLADVFTAIDASTGFVVRQNFSAVAGDSKSKQIDLLDFPGWNLVLDIQDSSAVPFADPFIRGLLVPSVPTYTLLALVNRLESISLSESLHTVITVDQDSEMVSVAVFDTVERSEAALTASVNAGVVGGMAISAAFLTVAASSSGPSTPGFGWE